MVRAGSFVISESPPNTYKVSSPKLTKEFKSYLAAIFVVACDFLGSTIQIPVLPEYKDYFDDAKDMELGTSLGILLSSYYISQFIATPLFGVSSDRFGRRPLLILSAFGSCVGFVAQGAAPTFVVFCITRVVTGLFAGSRPVALAYMADAFPAEDQAKYQSGLIAAVTGSNMFAPLIGAAMAGVHITAPTYTHAGISLFCLVLSCMYLIEPERAASKLAGTVGASPTSQFKYWKLWFTLNACNAAYFFFTISQFLTIFPAHAVLHLNMNSTHIGIYLGCGCFMMTIINLKVFAPLSTKIRLPYLGLFGTVLMTIQLFTPAFKDSIAFSIISGALLFIGASFASGAPLVMATMIMPPKSRGACMAVYTMMTSFARFIAPLIVGPCFDIDLWMPSLVVGPLFVFPLTAHLILLQVVPIQRKPGGATVASTPNDVAVAKEDSLPSASAPAKSLRDVHPKPEA